MNRTVSEIEIQGFLDDKRIAYIHSLFGSRHGLFRDLDGRKADEIQIKSTVKTLEEMEELIGALSILKHCLGKPV